MYIPGLGVVASVGLLAIGCDVGEVELSLLLDVVEVFGGVTVASTEYGYGVYNIILITKLLLLASHLSGRVEGKYLTRTTLSDTRL